MKTTLIYDQCVKLLQERGEITYDQAARELKCNPSTVGKAYRQIEAAGQATINRHVSPFLVRQRSPRSPPATKS